jgi:hypothetical protein
MVPERGGKLRMVCPWHGDTAPSLVIYEKTQSWYCYGCGSGGDAFDFISRYEGLSLGEIARRYISDEHILASWRVRLRGSQEESHIAATYLSLCILLRGYEEPDREEFCYQADLLYSQGKEVELRGLFEGLRNVLIEKEGHDAQSNDIGCSREDIEEDEGEL